MNRGKNNRKRTECNLIQTDIFSCIENWKSMKKEKDMKKVAVITQIIEISDSESDGSINNYSLPAKKRPLKVDFFDDEEDMKDNILLGDNNIAVHTPLNQIEINNILPKKKRDLRASFNESMKDMESNSDTGIFDLSTSTEKEGNITSDSSLPCPLACSTPLTFNVGTPDMSINIPHLSLHDLIEISQRDSNCREDHSSTSSADTETTVIVEENFSKRATERRIQITQHIVIPPQAIATSSDKEGSDNKRCSDHERSPKKQKVSQSGDGNSLSNSSSLQNKTYITTDSMINARRETQWLTKVDWKNVAKDQTLGDLAKKEDVTERNQGKSIKECLYKEKTISTASKNIQNVSEVADETLKASFNKNVSNMNENSKDTGSVSMVGKSTPKRLGDRTPTKTPPNKNSNSPTKGSPSKSNITFSKGSPRKVSSPNKCVKTETKEKKMNTESLLLIIALFEEVFSSKSVNNLLEAEKNMIKKFFNMDIKYQYVCFKLIMRQKKWYNPFKLCRNIYVDMDETEVSAMVDYFEQNGIVDTDYIKDNILHLLERLENGDLRAICDYFRLKKTIKTKCDMIKSLMKYASTQPTLAVHKTTKDLLLDQIRRKMGRCVKVSEAFQNAFYVTYVLGTFTNRQFSEMKDYFFLYPKVTFPQFPIDDYEIFSSRTDFTMYAKARRYSDTLQNLSDHVECLQVSQTIFSELKALEANSNTEPFPEAPHLIRFTARSVYVSAISSMVGKLFAKYPDDTKVWLEYLIEKVDCPHKIGNWYNHLIWLYMRYLKPFDYNHAAQLLIKVLEEKRECLSEVQLYELRRRGKQLICTKKYKIEQINHDSIARLLPKRIRKDKFPERHVDATAMRSNDLGKKRNYVVRDNDGNRTYYNVEQIALNYYIDDLGYTNGMHCEGGLIKATFTLLFFDIIYSAHSIVPGAFISKIQSEPLDMNSRHFYPNRKEEIDKRLKQIESEWSDATLIKFLKHNYEKHSHEFAVCEVGVIIKEVEFLEVIVECVGRKVLAKIYERLVQNFRAYQSGLPDLFVWNTERKECMFVEVKGENDKLSERQTLWLDYLQSIGANIELCLVYSMGSKRKVKKKDVENASYASTSME